MSFWRCPVGGEPLSRRDDGRGWRCDCGHEFDVAREGYVNLLVRHQRRARPPGDSAEMVRRRRAFLDDGHYQPLADAVTIALRDGLSTTSSDAAVGGDRQRPRLVDAGCGEGYYSRGWPDALGAVVGAVDIAKAAVRAAARRGADPGVREYAVASVYDLPLDDGWADGVVSVFAPIETSEFDRVLRDGGVLVTVTPGPRHLWQLKQRMFAEPEEHSIEPPIPQPSALRRLHYEITVGGEGRVGDLLGMTPYVWYLDQATVAGIDALTELTTDVDFLVATYIRH